MDRFEARIDGFEAYTCGSYDERSRHYRACNHDGLPREYDVEIEADGLTTKQSVECKQVKK